MARFIVFRLINAIPVLLIVSFVSFSIMQMVPGDPASIMAGPQATLREVEDMRRQLGLDRPFVDQLVIWYGNLLHGDLGRSILLGRSVGQAINERLGITLALALFGFIITLAISVPAGVLAALRQNTWVDQAVMTIALAGVSLPNFWL